MKKRAKRQRRIARRLRIARLAAQIYDCNGDEADAHRMLSMIIMLESYVERGADNAAKKLGWFIQQEPATVTPLELVRSLRESTPGPSERK